MHLVLFTKLWYVVHMSQHYPEMHSEQVCGRRRTDLSIFGCFSARMHVCSVLYILGEGGHAGSHERATKCRHVQQSFRNWFWMSWDDFCAISAHMRVLFALLGRFKMLIFTPSPIVKIMSWKSPKIGLKSPQHPLISVKTYATHPGGYIVLIFSQIRYNMYV